MDVDLIYDDLPSVSVWFQNLLNKEEQLRAKNHKDDLSRLEDTNEFVWPSKQRYVFDGEVFQHLIMTSSESNIYTDHHEMRRLINLAYQQKNRFKLRRPIPADSKKLNDEFNQKLLKFVWMIFHLMFDGDFAGELPDIVTKYLNDPTYFISTYFCIKLDSDPADKYHTKTYWNVSCSFQTIIPNDEKATISNLDFMVNNKKYSLSEYIEKRKNIEKRMQQEKEEKIMQELQCVVTPITPDSSDNEMDNDIDIKQ